MKDYLSEINVLKLFDVNCFGFVIRKRFFIKVGFSYFLVFWFKLRVKLNLIKVGELFIYRVFWFFFSVLCIRLISIEGCFVVSFLLGVGERDEDILFLF